MRLRGHFAVVVLSAALLAVAGCSADVEGRGTAAGTPGPTTSGTPAPGPSTSPGAPAGTVAPELSLGPVPTAKAGGNATQACADALKASSNGTTAFVQQLTAVLEAEQKKDQAGQRAAEAKLESTLDTWAADLRKVSTTATDPQLKTTLGQLAGQVDKMTSDVETIDDATLGAIQDRLDALCPS
ncbi:hypothetical protein DFJ67_0228 [Asanoa ferruginea]|uniref:Uncharacterized protein n=1 Tax=Asanoa ferruginea TaxID=53367 RepID=A0A3D9ZAF1_9ACTN|nr:hypothetical protein [Asanoa ferruginea]REF94311.1 hypothetical protein DFJ67_0228 [Asanoa ferruginea]GIF52324.1 hypothetical protein Afe04nite_68630 [Asanoa ferruginea]